MDIDPPPQGVVIPSLSASPPGSTCVIVPGNYNKRPETSMWYPDVAERLRKAKLESGGPLFPGGVVLRQFPDYKIGRESVWIPFLQNELKVGQNHVIIGHSTGAIAALRYAETHKVLGLVLVSAYHTDLGIPTERQAEYFSRPWNWSAISQNAKWILQFASPTDELVPVAEQRHVAEMTGSQYFELDDRGHFTGDYEFPELVEAVLEWMKGVEEGDEEAPMPDTERMAVTDEDLFA